MMQESIPDMLLECALTTPKLKMQNNIVTRDANTHHGARRWEAESGEAKVEELMASI